MGTMENRNIITRSTISLVSLTLLGLSLPSAHAQEANTTNQGYTYDIIVKSTDAKKKTTNGKLRVQTLGSKARVEYIESDTKEASVGDYSITTDAGVSTASVSIAKKTIEWTGYDKSFKEINKEKALKGSNLKSEWTSPAANEKLLTRSFNMVYKQLVFVQKIDVKENHRFTIAPEGTNGPQFNPMVTSMMMDISTYALKFPEVQKVGAMGLVPSGFITKAILDLKAKVGKGDEGAMIEIETTKPVATTIDESIFTLPTGYKVKN
jgi:hypothetical protein